MGHTLVVHEHAGKGISEVIGTIILIVIVISLTGSYFLFFGGVTDKFSNYTQVQDNAYNSQGESFRIERAVNLQVSILNTGRTPVTNPVFYVGGRQVNAIGPTSIAPGQQVTYALDGAGTGPLSMQDLKVTTVESVDIVQALIGSIAATIIDMGDILPSAKWPGVVYAQAAGIIFQSSTSTELARMLDNGNFGIGTSSPGTKLDVAGSIRGQQLCIGIDCRSAWPAAGASAAGWATSASAIYNNTAGVDVGIGTNSPSYKLHVAGTLGVTGATTFNSVAYTWPATAGSNGQFLTSNGAGTLSWSAAGGGSAPSGWATSANAVYNNTAGVNVGIGTSTPGQKLSVAGTIESTSGGFRFPDGTVQATALGNIITANRIEARNNGNGNLYMTTEAGSLPGFPANSYPTLRTDSPYVYFSMNGAYSGSWGDPGIAARNYIDYDNPLYYVDPAGTSVLNSLTLGGAQMPRVKIMQVAFPAGAWLCPGGGTPCYKEIVVNHGLGVTPLAVIGQVGHTGVIANRLAWTAAWAIGSSSFTARIVKPDGSPIDDRDSIWVIYY